jgi:hypothetical protein
MELLGKKAAATDSLGAAPILAAGAVSLDSDRSILTRRSAPIFHSGTEKERLIASIA